MFLLTMAKVSAVSYTVDGGGHVAWDTALLQAKASLKVGALEHAMQSPEEARCRFSEEKRNLYIPTTLEQYDSMDEAKTACNANSDCGGVTLFHGNYETRQGPGLLSSRAGASSWVCETTSPLPRPTPRPVPRSIPQETR